ncbi:phytoene/squalene synthase family protein [Reichenbachiella sp. MALMAid0571]|uniref:phytoene/squalene synthase family protein n=1 Tax=Reichenbachiella sp. MALMAid0571 TaxID=3143939 RepID=UPI0032DF9826
MKALFDQMSVQCSKKVTSVYSTSFSLAVKMLSPKIQGDIHSIYGFVRLTDEIVDSFYDYDKELLLDEFEADLRNALNRKISLNPILNAFQEVVHKYNIDNELIQAFLSSMRADLHKESYNTKLEYETYIYGSADVVGLMCLKVFVQGNQEEYIKLKKPAMKLGSAFQKVNFLRDLKDDSELLNRSYFPHLQGKALKENTKTEIITEIVRDFEEAYSGIVQLPIVAKFGVYTAYIYYKKLLYKISKANIEQIKTSRIRINNPTKMMLLVRSFVNYKLNLL